jgi:LacI family transcriptional regulator
MRPVSVEQVARRAGVAKSTVSFVLNNKGNVSPETREKVLAVIKELGYTKDKPRPIYQLTREPVEKNVVAYINPRIRYTEAASEYIAGLRQSAKANNFSLTLAITSSLQEAESQFRFLEETAQPSGIVMIGVNPDDALISKVLELNVPSVLINRIIDHPDLSYVSINHEEVGGEAARYLLSLGHRQFVFVLEPDYNQTELARFTGFVKSLVASGKHPKLAIVRPFSVVEAAVKIGKASLGDLVRSGRFAPIETEEITAPDGVEVMQFARQVQKEFSPTCLVAASDTAAIKAQADLQSCGIKIPQEVSVMGFNNRATGLEITPNLTTIDESWQQQGYTAGQILMELAEHKERRSQKILLRHRLIERASTAKVS